MSHNNPVLLFCFIVGFILGWFCRGLFELNKLINEDIEKLKAKELGNEQKPKQPKINIMA